VTCCAVVNHKRVIRLMTSSIHITACCCTPDWATKPAQDAAAIESESIKLSPSRPDSDESHARRPDLDRRDHHMSQPNRDRESKVNDAHNC
jgi:hypothetical protein